MSDAPDRAEYARPARESAVRLRLDHVGVAVDTLGEAAGRWAALLDGGVSPTEEVAGERVRVAFLDVDNTRVELLEGTSAESPVSRFVARRGAGVHHLSFEVDGVDLASWFETLRRRGLRVIGDGPTAGAGGRRVFFVHPESTGGVLVEFSQCAGEGGLP